MNFFLDKLLYIEVRRHLENGSSELENRWANKRWFLESPKAYKGWPFPLRCFLAMRYTKLELDVVDKIGGGRLPRGQYQLAQEVLAVLEERGEPGWPWHFLFRAVVVYPLLILLAATLVLSFYNERTNQHLWKLYGKEIPNYSQAVFAKRAEQIISNSDQIEENVLNDVSLRRKILVDALPQNEQLRKAVDDALKLDGGEDIEFSQIVKRFATANRLLNDQKIPLYIEPQLVEGPCYLLVATHDPGKLTNMSADNMEAMPEHCKMVMVLPYAVDDEIRYKHKNKEYPVLMLSRLDNRPVVRGALGLTYKDGWGSQVYMSRNTKYLLDSVIPAATRRGLPNMLPIRSGRYDLQRQVAKMISGTLKNIYDGTYKEVEKLAEALNSSSGQRLASQIRGQFLRDTSNGTKFPNLGILSSIAQKRSKTKKEDEKEKSELAAKLLPILQAKFIESVAYHEVIHQIHNDLGWTPPSWAGEIWEECAAYLGEALPEMIDPEQANRFRHSIADESAAYLAQIARSEGVRTIMVKHLLGFSLNESLRGTSESYAAHVVLLGLCGKNIKETISLRQMCPSPDEAVNAYEMLRTLTDGWNEEELGKRAIEAYRELFREPIPGFEY